MVLTNQALRKNRTILRTLCPQGKATVRKEVLISINPDAHSLKGIDDIKYGVFSAQKAMLPKEKNLSSFSLQEFQQFLDDRKKMKGI